MGQSLNAGLEIPIVGEPMRLFLLLTILASWVPLAADTQKSVPAASQSPAASAPASEAKSKDIHRLLGVLGIAKENSDATRKQLKEARKDAKLASFPDAYWKDFESAASPEAFEKILAPLFEKTYTAEEIKLLIKIYSAPENKFLIDKDPRMVVRKEAFEAFSTYMTETGKRLAKKHGKAEPTSK